MTQAKPVTRYLQRGARAAFLTYACAGVLVLAGAWVWLGLAILEEVSEQSKAEAAGQTMTGFATAFGWLPLAFAHALGVLLLSRLGWKVWRGIGLIYAALSVIAASALGLGAAQLLFAGKLLYTAPVFTP